MSTRDPARAGITERALRSEDDERAQAWLDAYVRSDPPTRRKMVRDLALPIRRGISIAWGPAFEKRYDDEAWSEAIAEFLRCTSPGLFELSAMVADRDMLIEQAREDFGERAARVCARVLAKLEKETDPDGTAR